MNISRRRLKEIAFWALIVAGVGLCVGAVFYPVLAGAGIACFGAATAVRDRSEPERPQNEEPHYQIQALDNEVDIDLGHHNNVLIFRQAPRAEYRIANHEDEQKEHPKDEGLGVTVHERPPV